MGVAWEVVVDRFAPVWDTYVSVGLIEFTQAIIGWQSWTPASRERGTCLAAKCIGYIRSS